MFQCLKDCKNIAEINERYPCKKTFNKVAGLRAWSPCYKAIIQKCSYLKAVFPQTIRVMFPHEKINQCLTNINQCLTDIFQI